MKAILPVLALLLAAAPALAQSDPHAALAGRVRDATASGETPGLSVAILTRDGRPVEITSGAGISGETRFLSGSIGKTVTALIAVQLAGEGRLDLDAPISTWLSERPWWDRLENRDAITLRMLLNQSAGVPDYLEDVGFHASGLWRGRRPYSPDELIAFVASDTPEGEPGRHFAYSDTHYILAGLILEAATGETYHDLVRTRVIGPLGLADTEPLVGRTFARLADGHRDGVFGVRTTARDGRLHRNLDHEWAAGGLVTTPSDLATLFHAFRPGGAFEREAAVMAAQYNAFEPGGESGYGLGVYVRRTGPDQYRLSHGGDFGGYRSAALYDAESGIAIAVQANSKAFEAPGFAYELLDRLTAAE